MLTIAKKLATGLVLSGLVYAAPALAQSALAQQSTAQQSAKSSTTSSSTAKSTTPKSTTSKSTSTAKKTPPKPLVYVEDDRSTKTADASTSKTASGSTGKTANVSAKKPAATSASPKPVSADVTKAFAQNCPSVALTESKSKAAYNVTFERDPNSKGVKSAFGLHKGSKIEVMSKGGKELFSESGHSTGQLVKDACTSMGTPGLKVAKN